MGIYFPWADGEEFIGWLFVMFLATRGLMSLTLHPKSDFLETVDALIVDKNGMRAIAILMIALCYGWAIRCTV